MTKRDETMPIDASDVDFRGLIPESWLCVDCNMNTAPGLLNRVELENAAKELGVLFETNQAVITHPYPLDHAAVRSGAGTARASRMAASALLPARRPVATMEQRSA
jgi:hypothetical protein